MFAYRAPGVYFERLDPRPPAIGLVRTDIAGFVGIATRGPLHRAVKVESWQQFASIFGGHAPNAHLAYAVEGFFTNGGATCWVARVADPRAAKTTEFDLLTPSGAVALTLAATSPGLWAANMVVALMRVGEDRFTLTFRLPDGVQEVWRNLTMTGPHVDILDGTEVPALRLALKDPADWSQPASATVTLAPGRAFRLDIQVGTEKQESFPNLTIEGAPAAINAASALVTARDLRPDVANRAPRRAGVSAFAGEPRFIGLVLNDEFQGSQLVRVKSVGDASGYPENTPAARRPALVAVDRKDPAVVVGADGLESLRVEHFTGESALPGGPLGLETLRAVDEIGVVAIPDIMPKDKAAQQFKQRPVRCDLLDAEPSLEIEPRLAPEFPKNFDENEISLAQGALIRHCEQLADRVAILDSLPGQLSPPEVTAWRNQFDTSYAGLYWPWILVNDPLTLTGVVRRCPPSGHVAGIYARNDLRAGVHKAPANELVEGSKDLTAGIDDVGHGDLNSLGVNVLRAYAGRGIRVAGARTLSSDTALRYVNVRRLLLMIEESIDESCQWTVFEPNNPDRWREVARVSRNFVDGLWRRDMLDGASAEEAYFVKCDASTNPESETAAGRLTCLIGVRPPWPAEFVIVRIGKTESGTEIQETTGVRNG
jgi:phage tail sheath protein FI